MARSTAGCDSFALSPASARVYDELFTHAQTTTNAKNLLIGVTHTRLATTLAARINATATKDSRETASAVKVALCFISSIINQGGPRDHLLSYYVRDDV